MLVDVWPCLNFWFCLAIISSPLWVLSFVFMDFIQKTSGLGFIFLCLAPALLCFAGDLVLWYFYLHPPTNRFFRKYERTGSSIGAVLLVLGNVGLRYFDEKSVACCLTFLFLAFYYLCALFCIQPYTGFGALEFLLSASVNVAFDRFGLHKPYPWPVVVLCIVIFGIRYGLRPHHPREQATGEEVDFGQLEAGVLVDLTNNEDPSHLLGVGAQLDNNSSPSDIFREPAPACGSTTPLLQEAANERRTFVLKLHRHLHCENCAKDVKKFVRKKINGVDSVDVIDQEQGKVRISGNVEPQTVIEKFRRHMKVHAELLVEDEEEEENPPKNDNQEMQIVNKPIREFVDQRKVVSLLPDPSSNSWQEKFVIAAQRTIMSLS